MLLELQEVHPNHKSQTTAKQRQPTALTGISRCDGIQLSYNDFFWNYMDANIPVVLADISNDWHCRCNWLKDDNNVAPPQETDNFRAQTTSNSTINFDYLRQKMGNCQVPVADCSTAYFNSHSKREMPFFDFLQYWQQKSCNEDPEISNSNATSTTTENLYLKDWHLQAQKPGYDFYRVPRFFASDWLNEHLLSVGKDDYRFVYMGPKDSWTPFHADVFGSYSWSTNISGCKKWLLLPPNEEKKLCDKLGNLPFSITENLLEENDVKFFTLYQKQNEAIFVPSGWYHQVQNLTDTISVNHNWFNACNVQRIWQNLCANMQQVINEIADCRQMDNFEEHCQMMLRASFGINYSDFLELLENIAQRRMKAVHNINNNVADADSVLYFGTYKPNAFHVRYDVQRIGEVLEMMLQDAVVCDSRANLYRRCLTLRESTKVFERNYYQI